MMIEIVCICAVQYGSHLSGVTTEHGSVANVMGKLYFTFCLILIHLNLKSHMWLMAPGLGTTDLEKDTGRGRTFWSYTEE